MFENVYKAAYRTSLLPLIEQKLQMAAETPNLYNVSAQF